MIPALHTLRLCVWALFFDEKKFRRWMRALVAALGASGATWADQLEPIAGHRAALLLKVLGWLCMVGAAMHGDPLTSPAAEPAP